MNVENNNQPTGSLKISQDVLATIANFASEEIDGRRFAGEHLCAD